MHPITKKRIESFLSIVGIIALSTIVFTPGLCWLFFDKELGQFFTFLDGHSKAMASLLKIVVVISGIILLAAPIVIVCFIYTATKEHLYDKRSLKRFRFRLGIQNVKRLSLKIGMPAFNTNFTNNDIDHFIKNELDKLQIHLIERRDEYLSMYNNGPLFLTEARDRLKDKMSKLLDYQDEVILSMHAELHLEIIDKIRHYQMQMKDGSQNDKVATDRSKYYSNELEDFYTDIYTAFTKRLADLNGQLQTLSDDHFDSLQNLSNMLSKY
ncbi:hypothetical protein [Pinibacter aurantiacus]|uniref:Uncharacterized protein n=1 Tax=Pinibacter aurantiacus TaxID=2851599 RepID=A0A9E2W9S2_9BACT|nr:hypothetical protein [Pinibacter aurantiacus]MBV4360511.1 hypothetical protein [Pinibacter aurantiacus]